jgi:mandelate racemase
MTAAKLTLRSLATRAGDVPLGRPRQTSGGAVQTAPLVLVDLDTEEGVTGCGYVFVYAALALAPMVALLRALGEIISCGLGIIGPARAADEARELAAPGFGAIKVTPRAPRTPSSSASPAGSRSAPISSPSSPRTSWP